MEIDLDTILRIAMTMGMFFIVLGLVLYVIDYFLSGVLSLNMLVIIFGALILILTISVAKIMEEF
jgi:hypothetical protein